MAPGEGDAESGEELWLREGGAVAAGHEGDGQARTAPVRHGAVAAEEATESGEKLRRRERKTLAHDGRRDAHEGERVAGIKE